jgi:hypothetical protein
MRFGGPIVFRAAVVAILILLFWIGTKNGTFGDPDTWKTWSDPDTQRLR